MKCKFACVLWMFVVLLTASSPAQSLPQSPMPLPGCEAAPEIRKTIHEQLDGRALEKMPFRERVARRRAVYEELIAKYPREVEPYNDLIAYSRYEASDQKWFKTQQERFGKWAEANPDDPLALAVAGSALYGTDTPESLRLMESARAKAPQFPFPALELAWFYSTGLRKDKAKSADNLTAYFALCPDSIDERAQWLLAKNEDLEPRVAKTLRASLTKATDPERLEDYEALWAIEFRSHPPQEHDAVRKQVLADLKRIEFINPKPDSEWLAFLIRGYQQSGASTDVITPIEDRLLQGFPRSNDAYDIVRDRWNKEHKTPDDPKDLAAWTKYQEAYKAVLQTWIHDFPDSPRLDHSYWFYALSKDETVSEKDGIAALDDFIQYDNTYNPPYFWSKYEAADFLLNHKWEPERAIELLQQARAMAAKERAFEKLDDNVSATELDHRNEDYLTEDLIIEGHLLKAAQLAARPEVGLGIKEIVDGLIPTQAKLQSDYWWNRARLAALENRKQDALAYYQLALHTRLEAPSWSRGKFRDDLTDEAQTLWKQEGGTTEAWAIWSKPIAKSTELAQGRWEKPKNLLPAFEVVDLSGKTWRAKDLAGKSVLINVWASWCGPCNAELPKLQKLYEQVKDRPDIQILTFDIDQDLGTVAPFLKDKGYTFPVVPAYTMVNNLLDDYVTIPQNWIVDTKGTWLWTQIGYGDEGDWAQTMTQKLEAAKASN